MTARWAPIVLAVLACGPGTGHGRAERRGTEVTETIDAVPVCGFEVTVQRLTGLKDVDGELIAVSDAGVDVGTAVGLVRVPHDEIDWVVVTVLPELRMLAGAWTALGTVSAVSHGYYAVISAPVWLIAGSISAVSLARSERWGFAPGASELHEYARFPQGLPAGWPGRGGVGRCPPESARSHG